MFQTQGYGALGICCASLADLSWCHGMQGASPMASRLSSQHASHSSTPAHTFTGIPAAPTTSMLPKMQHQDQQQQPALQHGVQVMQVTCTNQANKLMTGFVGIMTCPCPCLLAACPHSLREVLRGFNVESPVLTWPGPTNRCLNS